MYIKDCLLMKFLIDGKFSHYNWHKIFALINFLSLNFLEGILNIYHNMKYKCRGQFSLRTLVSQGSLSLILKLYLCRRFFQLDLHSYQRLKVRIKYNTGILISKIYTSRTYYYQVHQNKIMYSFWRFYLEVKVLWIYKCEFSRMVNIMW